MSYNIEFSRGESSGQRLSLLTMSSAQIDGCDRLLSTFLSVIYHCYVTVSCGNIYSLAAQVKSDLSVCHKLS